MGYLSKVKGSIGFSPGLTVDEVRNHPILRKFEKRSGEFPDLEFRSYDGNLLNTIECPCDYEFKVYEVSDNLEEIVAALPDREFFGRLEIYGEEDGDIWGLRVKNGEVEQIEPELVWPD